MGYPAPAGYPTQAQPPGYPLPAVSTFNARWEAFGGALAGEGFGGSIGSVAMPLARQFGFQFDSLAGTLGGNFLGGAAAHAFWRDPAVGSVGVYAADAMLDRFGGLNVTQVGLEGFRYWNRWSVGGVAGVEFGNSSDNVFPAPGGGIVDTYDIGTRFFDEIDLSYYLTDDFKLNVGHRYLGGENAAALGAEWAFPLGHGITGALFAEGRYGGSNFRGVWGGLTFSFGPAGKTLIEREREDTITRWLPDTAFSIKNSESRRFAASPAPPPPPPAYPGPLSLPTPPTPQSQIGAAGDAAAAAATAATAAASAALSLSPYPPSPPPDH